MESKLLTETTVISVSPVVLAVPHRPANLSLRISGPRTGQKLPIILLSHGVGLSNNLSSLNGYGPLANYWAAHGFIVIQPTHLGSKTVKLDPSTPGAPIFWRTRAEDMKHIIDKLDEIESLAPEFKGRLDHTKLAVAGVSMGGITASMLLGATVKDASEPDQQEVDMTELRIKAGLILSGPGTGGANLNPAASARFSYYLDPTFDNMKTPALVVVGDKDAGGMSVRESDWHAEPYTLSPGPKSLLTLFGAGHLLGGVSGYDAAETTDESPERVALINHLTVAYLKSVLYAGDNSWQTASQALNEETTPLGKIESKA